jgi:hypothetical protein
VKLATCYQSNAIAIARYEVKRPTGQSDMQLRSFPLEDIITWGSQEGQILTSNNPMFDIEDGHAPL